MARKPARRTKNAASTSVAAGLPPTEPIASTPASITVALPGNVVVHIAISIESPGAAPQPLSSEVATAAARSVAPPPFAPLAAAFAPPEPLRPAGPSVAEEMLEQLPTRVASAGPLAPSALRPLPLAQTMSMDPRLQLAVANMRSGKPDTPQASVDAGDIAVIARVGSVEAWEAMPDVVPGSTAGKLDDDTWIVTGRIPLRQVEAVRRDPNIRSLKATQPIHPNLAKTPEAMGVRPEDFAAGLAPGGGAGVVVGIVDFGCDYAHRNFLDANGRTRIEAIWEQGGISTGTPPFNYGREYDAAAIDAALLAPNPYVALGYAPPPDNLLPQPGAHGTHVMDIAAGNGNGTQHKGVAPEATLIFVEASATDVPGNSPDAVNHAFGDSVRLLEAVRYIFDTAGPRPCVVNLSLGTNGGPHDGSSLVEKGLDAIVKEQPNRAVVIAASNSHEDGIHTSGTVPGNGPHDIGWQLSGDSGAEFELWYSGARQLSLSLVAPDGTVFGPVAPGQTLPLGPAGQIVLFMSNRADDPNNHDNVLGIWVAKDMAPGVWTVRVASLDGVPVDYHAWIERNNESQSFFAAPVFSHTLGSISTGLETIVVGSYDGHKPQSWPLSKFSSAGPTRDGRQKPEVSAPGQSVAAAWSRTQVGFIKKNGTSMAAPAVTGLVALMLAEAQRTGASLTSAQIREKLQTHAQPLPGLAAGWHDRYGFGRASGRSI